MQNTNYLITVCQHIHKMGKTPSVALIRQYADRTLTIPEIVKALQTWKINPQLVVNEEADAKPESSTQSLEARVAALETLVAQLSSQLCSLNKS